MAAPPNKSKPGLLATLWGSERWLLASVISGVGLGLCLIGLIAAGVPWVNASDAEPVPQWVTTDTVRATTSDGKAVKAKMAMDAPDSDTRAWLNSRPRQVAMLMQISVSEYDGRDITGGQRVQRLADDMEDRLNDMLEASHVPPVRDVVIQDFVISTP